jgi:hypothetical protein
MVYSLDILNNKISEDNQVFIQSPSAPDDRSVIVYFNGSGIHKAAGPTPMVELSSNVERNDIGEPMVINNTITVMGKVVKNSGIKNVMEGIKQLKNIFKPDSCGLFRITCDSSEIYSASGVRFVSLDFNQTSDNWVNTAEYVAKLEYLEPGYSGWYVKSYSDNWNIEPLEDYVYADDKIPITHKVEYDNPKIKQAATAGGGGPAQPRGATPTASYELPYRSIPQFKVSRTISAVGIPSGTGSCNPIGSTIPLNMYPALAVSAFYEAKKWVEGRASSVFSSPNTIWTPMGGSGYLYNHLRVVNFDIHAGKYEITDTWLGMPTGISFIEDYTIETSTDDKYIHTVSVQGEIRGLNIANPSITGTPYVKDSGNPIKLDLTGIGTGLLTDKSFSPAPSIESSQTANTASSYAKIKASKYANALSGWIYDVKPYLYRRACIGMNSKDDRTKGYVGTPTNPPQPPNNPIYSKHNVLNIIPISTSETHNVKRGSISYNYQFNNKFTIISGVLYENVSMEDTGPTAVIGEAFVLGRALGPVLQSLNTTTSARKTITIELGVVPPTSMNGFFITHSDCPLYTGGTIYKTVSGMIEGFKPFGDRIANIFGSAATRTNMAGQAYLSQDTQQWEPNSGRYVRTVGWVYQQCTSAKSYLDH